MSCSSFLIVSSFHVCLYRINTLWLTASAVSFTSNACSLLTCVDDDCRWSVGSCAPLFQLLVFIGGFVSTSGGLCRPYMERDFPSCLSNDIGGVVSDDVLALSMACFVYLIFSIFRVCLYKMMICGGQVLPF